MLTPIPSSSLPGGSKRVEFALVPFQMDPLQEGLDLGGWISRHGDQFTLQLRLRGPVDRLRLATPAPTPSRLDDLWKTTCFEVFLAADGQDPYWEFNLSPAGHWNVYRLGDYRRELAPEQAYQTLPFSVVLQPERLELQLTCDLPPPLVAEVSLKAGVCAVLAHGQAPGNDGLSYWALAHQGPVPDFHLREGFRLQLAVPEAQ